MKFFVSVPQTHDVFCSYVKGTLTLFDFKKTAQLAGKSPPGEPATSPHRRLGGDDPMMPHHCGGSSYETLPPGGDTTSDDGGNAIDGRQTATGCIGEPVPSLFDVAVPPLVMHPHDQYYAQRHRSSRHVDSSSPAATVSPPLDFLRDGVDSPPPPPLYLQQSAALANARLSSSYGSQNDALQPNGDQRGANTEVASTVAGESNYRLRQARHIAQLAAQQDACGQRNVGGSKFRVSVRRAIRIPPKLRVTCLCTSTPVPPKHHSSSQVGSTVSDFRVFFAFGVADTGAVFVLDSENPADPVTSHQGKARDEYFATAIPPHISATGAGDTDGCSSIVWVRNSRLLGAGYRSGKVAWFWLSVEDRLLHHIATFPLFSTNTIGAVRSAEYLEASRMVVFGTNAEVLAFDVSKFVGWHEVPMRSAASPAFASALSSPLQRYSKPAEYVSCHPTLPFVAILSKVSPTIPSTGGAVNGGMMMSGGSNNKGDTMTQHNWTLQILESRGSTNLFSCHQRVLKQNCRPDAVFDLVWKYSADLVLVVCNTEENYFRLLRFTAVNESYDERTNLNTGKYTTLMLTERMIPFACHSINVANVEWMSAASAMFDTNHGDLQLMQDGQLVAPGFGETSYVVGLSRVGELAVTTVPSDPIVSWSGDSTILVALGTTVSTHSTQRSAASESLDVSKRFQDRISLGFGLEAEGNAKACSQLMTDDEKVNELLFRYVAVLESTRVCGPYGAVPGVMELATLPVSATPTNAQLLESTIINSKCSDCIHCPSNIVPGGGNDPRRLMLLHIFGWMPYRGPVNSFTSTSKHYERPPLGTSLTNTEDVEKETAKSLFFKRYSEAAQTLLSHQHMSCCYGPLATLLLCIDSSVPFSQQISEEVSEELISGISSPWLVAALLFLTDNRSSLLYDDTRLPITDRLMIALLKFPDNREFVHVVRSYFLPTTSASLLRLLLEGIHDETVAVMQRLLDNTSAHCSSSVADVQVASCVFARLALLGPSRTNPTTRTVWNGWSSSYRAILDDRHLFCERAQFDLDCTAMERIVESERVMRLGGTGTMAAINKPNASVTTMHLPDDEQCVCGGRVAHLPLGMAPGNSVPAAKGSKQQPNSTTASNGASGGSAVGGGSALAKYMEVAYRATGRICSVCEEECDVAVTLHGDATLTCNSMVRQASAHHTRAFCAAVPSRSFVWCSSCGHGGHWDHLQRWFAKHCKCPVMNCLCFCHQPH